jgi:hypothetical protein
MTSDQHESLGRLRALLQAHDGQQVLSAVAGTASRAAEPPASEEDNGEQTRHALAVFDAAFLTAAADGVLSDDEVDELATVLSALTQGEASDEDLGYLLENFSIALEQEGSDARWANVAEALDTATSRRLAFVAACGVAMLGSAAGPDGESPYRRAEGDAERAMFDRLAETLSIPKHEATALLQEIEAKLSA